MALPHCPPTGAALGENENKGIGSTLGSNPVGGWGGGRENHPQTPPPPKVVLQVLLPPQSLVRGSAVNMIEWLPTPKPRFVGKHGSIRERERGPGRGERAWRVSWAGGPPVGTSHPTPASDKAALDQEGPRRNEDPPETTSERRHRRWTSERRAGHRNIRASRPAAGAAAALRHSCGLAPGPLPAGEVPLDTRGWGTSAAWGGSPDMDGVGQKTGWGL